MGDVYPEDESIIYYDPNDPNDPNHPDNYQGDYDPNDPNAEPYDPNVEPYDPNMPPEIPGYEGWGYDPATGAVIDPATGTYIDPESGYALDPETGYAIDPTSGDFVDPATGQVFTAEEAEEANAAYAAEGGYDDYDSYPADFVDQELAANEFVDESRAIKFAKPAGRQKTESKFHGNEMKIMWLQRLDERVYRKNWTLFILCMFGVLLLIIHLLVNWDSTHLMIEGSSNSGIALKFGIGFTTVMAVCALFDLYQLEVYIWRKYYKPAGEGVVEYGWPLSFLLPFLVETAIIMVHPLPFFSDDKVGLFMFMRLYLVVRLVRNESDLYQERHIIGDKAYQDRGGPEFDCALILRMTFDERPGPCLALCFVVLSMATGFCSYICARESIEIEADFTYVKAVWGSGMLLVTGMCMYPVESDWSKVIEVCTLTLGTLLFAMTLAVVHNEVVLKPQDRFGLKHIAHANRVELQEKQAAILLQNWWRLLRMERKNRVTTQDYLDFSAVCTRHKRVRERVKTLEKSSMDPTLDKMLSLEKHFGEIKADVSDIKIAQDIMRTRALEMKSALEKAKAKGLSGFTT